MGGGGGGESFVCHERFACLHLFFGLFRSAVPLLLQISSDSYLYFQFSQSDRVGGTDDGARGEKKNLLAWVRKQVKRGV